MRKFADPKMGIGGDNKLVTWGPRYITNISIVDKQHHELFKITNTLFETCLKGHEFAREQFAITASKLVTYITEHFKTEEVIMLNVNYPHYKQHKKAHDSFIRKVLEEVKNFEEGKKFVPNTFVLYLRDWIASHIAMSDKKISDYVFKLKKEGRLLENIAISPWKKSAAGHRHIKPAIHLAA
jgi:hemerythrin